MITKLDKTESKRLKFVSRARAKDDFRPALQGVNVNGAAIGCDGFRIHAVNMYDLPDFDAVASEGTVIFDASTLRVSGDGSIIEVSPTVEKYPDYHQVIEEADKQEIVGEIHFDPKFMIDALREMDKGKPVRIVIHDPTRPFELFGQIEGRPTYALIMPMHAESDKRGWKPRREPQDGD